MNMLFTCKLYFDNKPSVYNLSKSYKHLDKIANVLYDV